MMTQKKQTLPFSIATLVAFAVTTTANASLSGGLQQGTDVANQVKAWATPLSVTVAFCWLLYKAITIMTGHGDWAGYGKTVAAAGLVAATGPIASWAIGLSS